VRIRRETKGRGGKAVTVIAGIPEHPDTVKTLCKQLKKQCGVGGAVKGDTIEIQGEQRAVCQEHLEKMGYRVKLSGG
jgi:translation initiation factor 1